MKSNRWYNLYSPISSLNSSNFNRCNDCFLIFPYNCGIKWWRVGVHPLRYHWFVKSIDNFGLNCISFNISFPCWLVILKACLNNCVVSNCPAGSDFIILCAICVTNVPLVEEIFIWYVKKWHFVCVFCCVLGVGVNFYAWT